MPSFRQLDTPAKLYGCFAIMWCTAAALAWWAVSLAWPGPAGPGPSASLAVSSAIVVFAVATLLLARWLRGEIDQPYKAARRLASRMASGDLSSADCGQCIDRASEAGALLASLHGASDALGTMAGMVRTGTAGAASSAGQLAAAGLHLATRTALQSALLDDAGAALRRLDASAGDNTNDARQSASAAASAAQRAASSGADIAEGAVALGCCQAASARIGALSTVLAAIAGEASGLIDRAAAAGQTGAPSPACVLLAEQAREMAQRAAAAANEIGALAGEIDGRAETGIARLDGANEALRHAAAGIDQAGQWSAALAEGCAAHQAAVGKLADNIAAIGLSASATASVAADTASSAAGMREHVDAMARASAALILAPRHGQARPGLHLVSDRSGKVLRLRQAGATGQAADKAPSGRRKSRVPHKVRPDLE